MVFPPIDFESIASANSATSALLNRKHLRLKLTSEIDVVLVFVLVLRHASS